MSITPARAENFLTSWSWSLFRVGNVVVLLFTCPSPLPEPRTSSDAGFLEQVQGSDIMFTASFYGYFSFEAKGIGIIGWTECIR